jgi:V8-like Glu-specific endopeptidase
MRTKSDDTSRDVTRWHSRRLGRLLPAVSTLVVGLVVAAISATPVSASPALTGPSTQAASGQATVWDPQAQREVTLAPADAAQVVRSYWTPERMDQARPVSISVADWANELSVAAPRPGEEKTIVEPMPAGVRGTESAAHYSLTNGKVFFLNPVDGQNYVCSGGAVNSGSLRLVVTAGHCVHPGNGGNQWMQNWIFIPGYQNGSEPRGRFAAYWYFSSTGWTQNGNHQRDFAFVTTHTNASNQLLVNAVGGHGLTINPGRPYVHVAGYPGNLDGGQVQWNCWGTTSRWSLFDNGQKLACGFGGGSSGGPWLRDFGASGLGYVISNMQGIAGSDNYGPYYDNHVGDVFAGASNVAP